LPKKQLGKKRSKDKQQASCIALPTIIKGINRSHRSPTCLERPVKKTRMVPIHSLKVWKGCRCEQGKNRLLSSGTVRKVQFKRIVYLIKARIRCGVEDQRDQNQERGFFLCDVDVGGRQRQGIIIAFVFVGLFGGFVRRCFPPLKEGVRERPVTTSGLSRGARKRGRGIFKMDKQQWCPWRRGEFSAREKLKGSEYS